MEPDSSEGFVASNPSPTDSLRDSVACFVRYLELRLELFGLESRETAFHLLVLALLLVSTVVCLGGFVIMLVLFLLYLMMLTLHWEWASCAAILGWLLSRIPARKKRIYIHSSSQKPVISRADGPLGKLWREVWKISKPLIAAYALN